MDKKEYYRRIPKVDDLLKAEKIQGQCVQYGRGFVVNCIREALEEMRALVDNGTEEEIERKLICFAEDLPERIEKESGYSLRKVINATGIILHTNLGRAPLGKVQKDAMVQAMCGYSNLEYDLSAGQRGKRQTHYRELLSQVTGAEAGVAVNNNAASLTLIFSALAKGKEVIVSRGESIEIGGRFRIPEVVEESGARLKEVGTTNRTRISDYEKAITENTGALLKVHTSNYKIVGFTEEASLEELAELGKKYNLPVIMDLGSGVLVNLEKYGLAHEPTVQEAVKAGADLVCFSGDKLLGGPQAGIIAGKKEYIQMMESYPLMRAIRLDKCIIAALEATLREYLDEERAVKTLPVPHMIARPLTELKEQAEKIVHELADDCKEVVLSVESSISMVGGGSLPGEELSSYAIIMEPKQMSCEQLMSTLRELPVPVIAHVKNDRVLLDMRTVLEEDVPVLREELKKLLCTEESYG